MSRAGLIRPIILSNSLKILFRYTPPKARLCDTPVCSGITYIFTFIAHLMQYSCFFSDAGPVMVGRSTYSLKMKAEFTFILTLISFSVTQHRESFFQGLFSFRMKLLILHKRTEEVTNIIILLMITSWFYKTLFHITYLKRLGCSKTEKE